MSGVLKSISNFFSLLRAQSLAAILVPLAASNQFGRRAKAYSEDIDSCDLQKPLDTLFNCVSEHPGRMTRNGRGSLEIGAALDD